MFARIGLVLLLGAPAIAQVLPPGFSDALVAQIGSPTALAFTPDERLLITTQGGALRVFQNGQLLTRPALSIPAARICSNSERGLLGVAVDPEFAVNRFIYLYYTFRRPAPGDCSANTVNSPVNRVSRFVLDDDSVIDLSSETVLVDSIASPNGNHNAGDLQFGADGYLYVSVGDGGCDYKGGNRCAGANTASRDENTLLGKVLRIKKDGAIPPDNPFLDPMQRAATRATPLPEPGARKPTPTALGIPFALCSILTQPGRASSSMMWGRTPGRRST